MRSCPPGSTPLLTDLEPADRSSERQCRLVRQFLAGSRRLKDCSSITVLAAVLTDCTCPLRPVQPLLRRGLRCGILRRRSFVADFLTKNSAPCPCVWTGLRRAQLRKLRQQPKQRGGEGSWPVI